MDVTAHPINLDAQTQSYLRGIGAAKGVGYSGVYIPRGGVSAWFQIIFGLVLLGVVVFLSIPDRHYDPHLIIKTACFAVGILSVVAGISNRRRKQDTQSYFGNFLYTDGLNFWDVTPHAVKAIDISEIKQASATHHLRNGSYQNTSFKLDLGGKTRGLSINNRPKSDELLRYFNILGLLRTNSDAQLRQAVNADPRLLTAMARGIYNGAGAVKMDGIDPNAPVVVPTVVPSMQAPQRGRMLWITFISAALIGFFILPLAQNRINDEFWYAQVKHNPSDADYYLNNFKKGAHVQAVTVLRDDASYRSAIADADTNHSPAQLRNYLADKLCTRHRSEAQTKINGYYDEAIARLKQLAADKSVDPQLFGGFLALLEGLKTSTYPVATVSFSSTQDDNPGTDNEKSAEADLQADLVKQHPDLQAIIDKSSIHSAVMSRGQTFAADQIRRRQGLILGQLSTAVSNVLNADLIKLSPATGSDTGMIHVAYHTYPSGDLFVLTSTSEVGLKTTDGLLRGYLIDWDIIIQPPGSDKKFQYKLTSSPANSLHMHSKQDDAVWAPYAVMLYSAFYDLSGKLISNFGLTAPQPPESFTFSEAVGTNSPAPAVGDSPDDTN